RRPDFLHTRWSSDLRLGLKFERACELMKRWKPREPHSLSIDGNRAFKIPVEVTLQLAIAHRALQLLEVFPCQQMGGIDLKCAFELRLGLGESAQFGKRTAQVCMCVGIVWPDANGCCEFLRGSREVSRRGQCVC